MKKLFAAILAVIGIPLELYFYWFRFVNEGMEGWIAIVTAIGLTVLLSTFVYFAKPDGTAKARYKWLYPALLVALFDIFSTSAGQSFAMAQTEALGAGTEAMAKNAEWALQDAEKEIVRLDNEYGKLTYQEDSITSIEERAKWKSTIENLAKAKTANRAARDQQQARKEAEAAKLGTASVGRKINVYAYYEALFGLPARWIQFILHTLLSVCIVSMAPVAVLLWPTEQKTVVVEQEEVPTQRTLTTSPVATRMMKKKDKSEAEVSRELEALERITTAVEALNDPADPREIGRALEMSHTPVYAAIKNGELAPLSMNPVRVSKDEVMRWVEARLGRELRNEEASA